MKKMFKKLLTIILIITELFVGFTCLWGGYELVFGNAMGLPLLYLSGSIFDSYFWPGVILAFVVGGTNLLAAWKVWRKDVYLEYYTAVAGFGILIWVFVEMYLIVDSHWLQAVYFSLAVLILVLTMVFLKLKGGGNE